MKKRYRVQVTKHYNKFITVIAEDKTEACEKAGDMMNEDLIEFDFVKDYDGYDIGEACEMDISEDEMEEITAYCDNLVSLLVRFSYKSVLEATLEDCGQYIEAMRERNFGLPVLLNAQDLWDAVCRYKGGLNHVGS